MNSTTEIQYIPLDKLRLSDKNARRQRSEESVAQLAASIAAHGLLQNLTVEAAADDATFDVIAGGTRLAALQLLLANGTDVAPVPCRIITNGEAIEASAAENLIRTRLAPADEFDAFNRMAESGKSRAEIANHFGVPEIVVTRSLKLANVDPQLFAIFRAGGMELEQLQALSLSDNHELQREAWFAPAHDYERRPGNLRERLTNKEIDGRSGIAKFIGVEAYEAAGGQVRCDLFSDRQWFTDRALLDRLVMDRLEERAQILRSRGWSWVETHLSLDHSQLTEYPRGFNADLATQVDLTEEQNDRLSTIDERIQEIDELDPDSESVELERESSLLEREANAIHDSRELLWPDHVRDQAGCIVRFNSHEARITVDYARLRPGQKLDASGSVSGKAKPTQAEKAAAEKAKPKVPTLSNDMVERLHLHHRAALRVAVASDPNLAIELMLTHMLGNLIGNGGTGLLSIRTSNNHRSDLDGKAVKYADVRDSSARGDLDALISKVKKSLPKKSADIQAWLSSRTVDELHQLFAVVTAMSLDPSKDAAKALAKVTKTNMAERWQPDAEFLGNVPKALAIEAVREVHGKEAAAKLEPLKSAALQPEAAKLLAGTGWLPKPLRGDGYQVSKSGKAAAATPAAKKKVGPKKTVAKAAPKPAAKKASAKADKPSKKAQAANGATENSDG